MKSCFFVKILYYYIMFCFECIVYLYILGVFIVFSLLQEDFPKWSSIRRKPFSPGDPPACSYVFPQDLHSGVYLYRYFLRGASLIRSKSTLDPTRFIFGVISHVASALCDQTGFRNIFGRTWLSIHKKLYPALLIELQFFSERLHGFPAALCMWHIFAGLSSFLSE